MRKIIVVVILIIGIFNACSLFEKMPSQNKHESILFLGDLGFGTRYHARYEAKGKENILKTKGYAYPFETIGNITKNATTSIANLETPLSPNCDTSLLGIKKYIHWCDTAAIIPVFENLNLTAVSLANNHTLDQGIQGLESTYNILEKLEIAHFGTGDSTQSAQAFSTFIDEKEILVVGGFEYRKKYETTYNFYAKSNGTKGVNCWNNENTIQQIKKLRQNKPEAFIVAYPHWGEDYKWKNEQQTILAHQMIDAGADLIIGHGVHRIQEIELYKNKWILYGIGNFVFNTPGRYKRLKAPPFSLAVKLQFAPKATSTYTLECTPIFSDNKASNFQARFLNTTEFKELTELLIKHSPTKNLEQYLLINEEEKKFLIK